MPHCGVRRVTPWKDSRTARRYDRRNGTAPPPVSLSDRKVVIDMDKVLIILSMFGCSDAGNQCELLDTSAEVFQSRAACERQIDSSIETEMDAPYPTIIANCGTPEETALIVKDLTPDASDGSAVAANNQAAPHPNS